MREHKTSSLGMLMIGMAALFLAGFLLLTVFGAQSFRSTAFGRGGNMDSRALSLWQLRNSLCHDLTDMFIIVSECVCVDPERYIRTAMPCTFSAPRAC